MPDITEAQEIAWCDQAYEEGYENSLLNNPKPNPYIPTSIFYTYWDRGNSQDLK